MALFDWLYPARNKVEKKEFKPPLHLVDNPTMKPPLHLAHEGYTAPAPRIRKMKKGKYKYKVHAILLDYAGRTERIAYTTTSDYTKRDRQFKKDIQRRFYRDKVAHEAYVLLRFEDIIPVKTKKK